jgi:hypothetical protein
VETADNCVCHTLVPPRVKQGQLKPHSERQLGDAAVVRRLARAGKAIGTEREPLLLGVR